MPAWRVLSKAADTSSLSTSVNARTFGLGLSEAVCSGSMGRASDETSSLISSLTARGELVLDETRPRNTSKFTGSLSYQRGVHWREDCRICWIFGRSMFGDIVERMTSTSGLICLLRVKSFVFCKRYHPYYVDISLERLQSMERATPHESLRFVFRLIWVFECVGSLYTKHYCSDTGHRYS